MNSLFNNTVSAAKVLNTDMEMGEEETPVYIDDKMEDGAEGIMQLVGTCTYFQINKGTCHLCLSYT